ncbi:restriction endonuclease subunit S [Glaciecola sp. SC05]|uniref:restriction endonuclease subunit S n=1 Tax=Glaciecola sp. SC05 TaxID=1987355 RepID=UPI0035273416
MIATASQPIPEGYKQTEVAVIPNDWNTKQLKNIFSLKNGYAFKGENFSDKGPIVLTPGNFKLGGGLYFENRNTKRYKGTYPRGFEFENGDLVLVMTDLTLDCNLLGQPAFIENEERVLHNQRIGKILFLTKPWDKKFIYYSLLSPLYLSVIKNSATGSTVRHTSPTTILNSWIIAPPKEEQTAIANALSDVDALLAQLEKLIAKKQAIKTATMQQLLTGKTRLPEFAYYKDGDKQGQPIGTKQSELGEIPEDWEVVCFGELFEQSTSRKNLKANTLATFIGMQDVSENAKLIRQISVAASKVKSGFTYFEKGDVLVAKITPCFENGKGCHTKTLNTDIGFGSTEFHVLKAKHHSDSDFIYYWTTRDILRSNLEREMVGSAGHRRVPFSAIQDYPIPCPSTKQEQTEIANILSDMDDEIQTLEQRLKKTRQVKQGMMQELLTGRTRLPFDASGETSTEIIDAN